LLAGVAFALPASAQDPAEFHGATIQKICSSTKVGDVATCTIRTTNSDDFSDTVRMTAAWDIQDVVTLANPAGSNSRQPAAGNLPIISKSAGATCTAGTGPIGLVFPCNLPDIGDFVTVRSNTYVVQAGDIDPLPDQANALVEDLCDGPGTVGCATGIINTLQFTAASNLFQPGISVEKSGPSAAKAGDIVTYSVTLTDTSSADTPARTCTATDTLAGSLGTILPGVPKTYNYTIPAGAAGTITNTVNVSCTIAGFANVLTASASHNLTRFTPSITVDKSGPASSKAGDTITYSVLVGNTSSAGTPALSCTATDSLAGSLGAVVPGTPKTYDYTIPAGTTGTVTNTVNVSCSIAGFPNTVSGSDSHDVTILSPSVSLTKVCRPSSVVAGETLYWDITALNTGNVALNCLLDDPTAGLAGVAVSLAPGADQTETASRATTIGDVGTVSNTATINCSLTGLPNSVSDTASDDCEVTPPQDEICRTPGFWGTHAGTEKSGSSDLTQMAITAAGGSLSICGRTITNTDLGSQSSAVEAICVSVQGAQQRQLARQLTAMALNCVISGGGSDCTGTSVESLFADANAACTANNNDAAITGFISQVDAYNNGLTNGCHDRSLSESDVFAGVSPLPGPAGSSTKCSAATKNQVYVVPVP
jgi:hypothetical protein